MLQERRWKQHHVMLTWWMPGQSCMRHSTEQPTLHGDLLSDEQQVAQQRLVCLGGLAQAGQDTPLLRDHKEVNWRLNTCACTARNDSE